MYRSFLAKKTWPLSECLRFSTHPMFCKKKEMVRTRPFKMDLMLNFSDGCGCKFMSIEFPVNFQVVTDNINHDKDVVVQKLRNTAIEDESCGQVSVVERETTLALKNETTVYAIATNVVWYIGPLACS